jgi:hypothetical protein
MKLFWRYLHHQLWKKSGGDFHVIIHCSDRVENIFSIIGLFVYFISFITFISISIGTTILLGSFWFGLPLALFIGWLVHNIYLVLLLTFSKNVLPSKDEKENKFLSRTIKFAFIVFIATVVSKPLEVGILYNRTTEKVNEYRENLIKEVKERRPNLNLNDENIALPDNDFASQVTANYFATINDSNFFIARMEYTIGLPESWLINAFMILIFLIPPIAKLLVSTYSKDYYKVKRVVEMRIISDEYDEMKVIFERTLKSKFPDRKFQYYEAFVDPPFNTILKKDRRIFKSQEDFLKRIYGS